MRKIFLYRVYTNLAYVPPMYRRVKKLRVRMINKDVRKSLAIKKGNEILIWSWNDSSLTGFIWDVYFRRHQYQLLLLTEYILGKVIICFRLNIVCVFWNLLFESDLFCYNLIFLSIFFKFRSNALLYD